LRVLDGGNGHDPLWWAALTSEGIYSETEASLDCNDARKFRCENYWLRIDWPIRFWRNFKN